MDKVIKLAANFKPSALTRRMMKHKGDVSEGTEYKILTTRIIIGKKVTFYRNGLRRVEGISLKEEEIHDSEILRLAHASILIGEPVGDKKKCYVDATKNPVEIWVYSMPMEEFLTKSKDLVKSQELDVEFLLEEPISKVVEARNVRNVRLFGR